MWASASGCSCCSSAPTRTTRGCWACSRVTWWPSPDAPRLPHIGWNQLEVRRPHALLDGVADGAPAYFVHSYVARPADPSIVVTETEHGSRFPSIIVSDRIIGYQPHPERSGDDGLRLLRNMLALTGAGVRSALPVARRRGRLTDAAQARHPLPRRQGRPGRQGCPVRGPDRRGRPADACRASRPQRRGRDRVPGHLRGARGARHAAGRGRADREAGVRAADRGRRGPLRGRDARRAPGRAPTRSPSTRPPSATRRC